ncbi:ATP-binding cassette domain-containing protein [Halovenus sp. WSH3]|uniref:ATP-binding cassette domain-containing protein n=1 Tax=Halovenus carboxidivorans TaxID=2692199 RepID=A0A6B0TG90_9EURY|nr:ABC transporter ATP-binding protein [Halovenus carboxidivorans]MXR52199.1 ATP-binding cassette domain-containing protein [Halovenus carboxidivorans]
MAMLEVEDLNVRFYTEDGVVKATNDLSYQIEAGERFGIVGESGAGKSVTSLSLLRLIDSPGVIESGEIRFKGQNLLELSDEEMRQIRGNEISMIFQDAETALNPAYTVGEQIAEAVRYHLDMDEEEARERSIELLEDVGIPDAAERYSDYPHQFSGGMQQRAVIAMALSCDPDLILADEPTTALDVTIEAQILTLLEEIAEKFDTAIQFITHDLGVVAEFCDRVMVMYAGHPVEIGTVEEIYYDPQHPYTVGLMSSIPRIGDDSERLQTIPGRMPDLIEMPPGCNFHPRCPYAEEICTQLSPELVDVETGQEAAPDDRNQHAAACLAHTGELAGSLDYEVTVRDELEATATDGSGTTEGEIDE